MQTTLKELCFSAAAKDIDDMSLEELPSVLISEFMLYMKREAEVFDKKREDLYRRRLRIESIGRYDLDDYIVADMDKVKEDARPIYDVIVALCKAQFQRVIRVFVDYHHESEEYDDARSNLTRIEKDIENYGDVSLRSGGIRFSVFTDDEFVNGIRLNDDEKDVEIDFADGRARIVYKEDSEKYDYDLYGEVDEFLDDL